MTVLFFLFIAFVIFHFVWEGIVAPSLRLELRYEIFKLRDKLRKLKIVHGDELDDEVYDALQRALNNEIALLHHATISDLYKTYKRLDDVDRRAILERIEKKIEESPVEGVKQINDRGFGAMLAAFFINSGGWFIYVLPALLVVGCYGTIKALIAKLVNLSANEINRLFPPSGESGRYMRPAG